MQVVSLVLCCVLLILWYSQLSICWTQDRSTFCSHVYSHRKWRETYMYDNFSDSLGQLSHLFSFSTFKVVSISPSFFVVQIIVYCLCIFTKLQKENKNKSANIISQYIKYLQFKTSLSPMTVLQTLMKHVASILPYRTPIKCTSTHRQISTHKLLS